MADGTLFGNLSTTRVIDLFCGAGGTSLGVEMGLGVPPVAAVNHWPYAIQIHARNHPETLHFAEDVFEVEPWVAARGLSIDLLVGSPDCTHFSVAKGGAPRSAGRRALADVFVKWARQVRPRVIILENVREFLTWGPLDEAGQPVKSQSGEYFQAWANELRQLGYVVEWRLLRACDYGAPTSRLRLFVVARCDGMPIRWPAPTHGPGLIPHHTAAECIDWSIPCPSIFDRKRPLAEATLRRIAQGIQKYVIDSASPFLLCLTHGGRLEPLTEPMQTVAAAHRGEKALVQVGYGERAGQKPRALDLQRPLGTVVSGASKHGLVAAYLQRQFGTATGTDLNEPFPTVMASGGGGKSAVVAAFLAKYYGAEGQNAPVDRPLDTATCKARFGLVTVQIDGEPYAIVDVGMRMLEPRELARAQGFPDSYILEGTKADQIAAIGNAVVPQVMAALTRENLGAHRG